MPELPDINLYVEKIDPPLSTANYCPCCRTGGRLLADRSLSRLLKDDWPDALP